MVVVCADVWCCRHLGFVACWWVVQGGFGFVVGVFGF